MLVHSHLKKRWLMRYKYTC